MIQAILITSIVLFALGVYGVLAKRDLLRIVISVTIILGSITLLAAVLAATMTTDGAAMAYSLVLFVWAVEVIEILIGLALFLYLSKKGITDISILEQFRW